MKDKNGPANIREVPEPGFNDEHVAHVIDEEAELEVWVRNLEGAYKPTWREYGEDPDHCFTTQRQYVNILGAIRGAYYATQGVK